MIFATFRRTDGTAGRVRIDRDDDQAVDFVLACACRHFGDPTVILPPPPPPPKKAPRR